MSNRYPGIFNQRYGGSSGGGGGGGVTSVNGDSGPAVVLDTDDIAQGVTNLYFSNELVDDRVAALLVAGTNITLSYNDVGNSLTVNAIPSGATTQVQYNNAGAFGASANFTWDNTNGNLRVDATGTNNFNYILGLSGFTNPYTGFPTGSNGFVGNVSVTGGGIAAGGFSNNTSVNPFIFDGYYTGTGDSTTVANVMFRAFKNNGSNVRTGIASTALAFQFRNNATSLISVLGDGKVGFGGIVAPTSAVHLQTAAGDFMNDHTGASNAGSYLLKNNSGHIALFGQTGSTFATSVWGVGGLTSGARAYIGTNTGDTPLEFGTNNRFGMILTGGTNQRLGIGLTAPNNKVEIDNTTANTSGLRFTRLTSASPTGSGGAIGVNASGDVVRVASGVTGAGGSDTQVQYNVGGAFAGATRAAIQSEILFIKPYNLTSIFPVGGVVKELVTPYTYAGGTGNPEMMFGVTIDGDTLRFTGDKLHFYASGFFKSTGSQMRIYLEYNSNIIWDSNNCPNVIQANYDGGWWFEGCILVSNSDEITTAGHLNTECDKGFPVKNGRTVLPSAGLTGTNNLRLYGYSTADAVGDLGLDICYYEFKPSTQ
jgi:hypothetical protein